MKKLLLRITSSDKYYSSFKNIDLSYWAKDYSKLKKIKLGTSRNKPISAKKKIIIIKKVLKISLKLNKIFYKNFRKIFLKPISYKEWQVIFLPFLIEFIYLILDRKRIIDIFFFKLKYNKIFLPNVFVKENEFNFNSTNELMKLYQDDKFNYHIISKIIATTKKNIFFLKRKTQYENKNKKNQKQFLHQILLYIRNYFKFFFASIAYYLNKKVVFESYYISKLEFFKLCLILKIFPYKINSLFNKIFSSSYDDKKRHQLLIDMEEHKLSKEEKMIINILIPLIPRNFIENINLIFNKYRKFRATKKIITSTSFYYNEIFRIFLILAKRNKTKIIQCDHGGGLSFKLVPINYVEKFFFNKFAVFGNYSFNGLQVPAKKKLFINPSLLSLNIKKKIKDQKYLSILFYESKKFLDAHNTNALQSFEIQNQILEELIYFTINLPKNIREKVLFRASSNFGLHSEKRFNNQIFKKFKYSLNRDISNNFLKTLSKTRIMISNYPSTTFSETMSLNIPSLLYCDEKEILLDKKSETFFLKMKKNNIVFNDIKKLSKHVKKIWPNPQKWWESEEIKKIRKYYLINYYNTLDNLKNNWVKELKKN